MESTLRNILTFTLLLIFLVLPACSRKAQNDPAYNRAQELIFKVELESDTIDYTRAEYAQVIEELEKVSPDYIKYEEAARLLEEIKDKRFRALSAKLEKLKEEKKNKDEEKKRMDALIQNLRGQQPEASSGGKEEEVSLIDLKKATESLSEGKLTVEGEVQNIGPETLSNIMVLIDFFDSQGNIIDSTRTVLKKSNLKPGDTTTFSTALNYVPLIKRYGIRFREAFSNKNIPSKKSY